MTANIHLMDGDIWGITLDGSPDPVDPKHYLRSLSVKTEGSR